MITTKLGFDLRVVLKLICMSDWDSMQKGKSGGARWYNDPRFGEQSFLYQYDKNKLHIDFFIASVWCTCEDINSCTCDDYQGGFQSWQDYWDAFHERVSLSKRQVAEIIKPNLFDQSNQYS